MSYKIICQLSIITTKIWQTNYHLLFVEEEHIVLYFPPDIDTILTFGVSLPTCWTSYVLWKPIKSSLLHLWLLFIPFPLSLCESDIAICSAFPNPTLQFALRNMPWGLFSS